MISLDGTLINNLGATILGVSLAVAKAAANELGCHCIDMVGFRNICIPMMNIINGGSHSDAPIAFKIYDFS
jgi:enolase